MVPDISLIQGAISSLKLASDIAKSFLHLKSAADVQGKVIELQSAILSAQSDALSAQSEQTALIQRIGALEEEIGRIKAWEEQKQRYALVHPWSSAICYSLKKESRGTEPAHWICANCYESGQKGILCAKVVPGSLVLECLRCQRQMQAPHLRWNLAFRYAEEMRDKD